MFAGRGPPHEGEGGQEAKRGETGSQEGGNAEGENTRDVVSKMMFGNLRPRQQMSLLLPVTLGTAARWRQL